MFCGFLICFLDFFSVFVVLLICFCFLDTLDGFCLLMPFGWFVERILLANDV